LNEAMRRWVAVLALFISACTQAASPIASSSQAAPATPVAATTPEPDLPLTKVDFSCRLPVLRTPGTSYLGGFLTFPAASFALDPRGGMHNDQIGGYSTDGYSTDATPVLHGAVVTLAGAAFYDLAQHRWVPAGPPQSTPDGAQYAYAIWDPTNPSTSRVHVVDVARATEKTFDVALPPNQNAMGFIVGDFDATGVYLVANLFEQLPPGVWLMDPATGAIRRVAQVETAYAIHGGYVWLAGIDPRDPSPPQLPKSGTPSDSIVRVNLATGDRTTWFYRPGRQVWLTGFDSSGSPIADVVDPSGSTSYTETWLTGGPSGQDVLIHAGSLYLAQPQGDGDRIWFGNYWGVYLFTRANGLRKVAAFNNLQTGEEVLPAGFCR
jgi:hypothetical protein